MNNFGDGIRKKKGRGARLGEDSLLERVTAAAENRMGGGGRLPIA
jgi:hypothetical protein